MAGNHKNKLELSALLCVLSVVSGCSHGKKTKPAPVVSYLTVTPQSVTVSRTYSGHTQALLTVDIRPRAEGYLKRFLFTEGQAVRKGQTLFEIDPEPYRIGLATAEAQLERARANVAQSQATLEKAEQDTARYAPLAKIRAIAQEIYIDAVSAQKERQAALQQARADEHTAQVAVSDARLKLSYTTIRAPISGIIGWRKADPGNLVGPQSPMPLATISSAQPIRVDFFLNDSDYLRYVAPDRHGVKRDRHLRWKLILADGSVYPHACTFYALGRTINPETDTIAMELLVDNPEEVLRPGQYAQVEANLETRSGALLVPVDAVQRLQGQQTVYVVDHGTAKLQSIRASDRSGNNWIVTSGIKPGDEVIVKGEQKVDAGEKVDAHPANAQAAQSGEEAGGGPS